MVLLFSMFLLFSDLIRSISPNIAHAGSGNSKEEQLLVRRSDSSTNLYTEFDELLLLVGLTES